MQNTLAHYTDLSALYAYPEAGFDQRLQTAQRLLDTRYPEAGALLQPFTEYMTGLPPKLQAELFVRSFDVQSLTTLDLGYVMFGDDYKRGELLVNLNREHREAGNDCGVELADHLSNVLRLLPKMRDEALRAELVECIVAPALVLMAQAFDPGEVALKDKFYKKRYKTIIERPGGDDEHYLVYLNALQALYHVLQTDFGFEDPVLHEENSDFLRNIHAEANLEDAKAL